MSQDNLFEDVFSDVNITFAKVINESSNLAMWVSELRIHRLRKSDRRDEQQDKAALE